MNSPVTLYSPICNDPEDRIQRIRHDSDSSVRTTDTNLSDELDEANYINNEIEEQFRIFRGRLSGKKRQEILDDCPVSVFLHLPTTSSSGLSDSVDEKSSKRHYSSSSEQSTDSSASDDVLPETCINDETEQEFQACQERYARQRQEQVLDDRKQTAAEILKSLEQRIKIWRESYDYIKEAEYIIRMCQESTRGSSQPDDHPPQKRLKTEEDVKNCV